MYTHAYTYKICKAVRKKDSILTKNKQDKNWQLDQQLSFKEQKWKAENCWVNIFNLRNSKCKSGIYTGIVIKKDYLVYLFL